MNRWSLLLLALPLTGCLDFTPFQGVWWVEFDPNQEESCELTIEENFNDGSPPEVVEPEGLITEIDGSGSPQGSYMLVTRGKNGVSFVNWGGEVYVGGTGGGLLAAFWESDWDGSTIDTYEGEYLYTETEVSSAREDVQMSQNKETKAMSGTLKVESSSVLTFTEDDEWDLPATGVTPQIPVLAWLVPDEQGVPVQNVPNQTDCSGDCEIIVTEDCSTTYSFEAFFAGSGDDGLFEAIEIYGQPAGSP